MTFVLGLVAVVLFANFADPPDPVKGIGFRITFLSLSLIAASLCFMNYKDYV